MMKNQLNGPPNKWHLPYHFIIANQELIFPTFSLRLTPGNLFVLLEVAVRMQRAAPWHC
jgi:hypothetical protein